MIHWMNAFDDLSLEFIILLMEHRTHFRAVCVRVNRVGATVIALLCAMRGYDPFPPVFERRMFWGPWVGDLKLTEEGAIDLQHFRCCIRELDGMATCTLVHSASSARWMNVNRVHGVSEADIIDHLHIGGQFVSLLKLWRAARFPV